MNSDLPEDILALAEAAVQETLPEKSSARYKNAFDVFINWEKSKGINGFSEEIMLAYFGESSKKYAPSTLWSMYSMLKSTIICNHNINISKYSRLISFLKNKNIGYKPKKANVFTPEDLFKFLVEAPDDRYLAMKTMLLFGIIGCSRGDEIVNVMIDQVKDEEGEIIVKVPNTKTHVSKMYSIDGKYADIVRRYMKLRPKNAREEKRFFLHYRNGRCTVPPIGKNTIATMPKEMAKFLELEDPEAYTGHSLRRSSATLVANSGAGVDLLKRLGDWKSNRSAEDYVADSIGHKRKMRDIIQESINLPSTSNGTAANPPKKIVSATTSSVTVCSQRKVSTLVNMDYMFDDDIDESKLVEIVDRASQRQLEESPDNRCDVKDENQTNNIVAERSTDDTNEVLTQSDSSLNGAVSSALKCVNFERVDNCTFNFYVRK